MLKEKCIEHTGIILFAVFFYNETILCLSKTVNYDLIIARDVLINKHILTHL